MAENETQIMRCMEVWGGNRPVNTTVAMAGLDAWVYSKPFGGAEGGGDVYYVSSCATGRITRLMVADVAGHGADVRGLATTLRGLMRQHVNQLNQSRFVSLLNSAFTELSENGIFATAIVTTFFSVNNHLSLCNAGHPPPLLYSADRKNWAYLERAGSSGLSSSGLPLGIEGAFNYTDFEIAMKKGDMILAYTDSLIEARFPDGELLGLPGLLEIVRQLNASEPEQLTSSLIRAILEKTGDQGLAHDDITVLLFRAKSAGTQVSFFTRAFAPIRLLGKIVGRFRPGGEKIPWPDFNLANLAGAAFHPLARNWAGGRRRG